jgi:hypothetical protein
MKLAQLLLNRLSAMPAIAFLSINNNLKKFNTNLTKEFFISLGIYFALYKNAIFFCDLPIVKTGTGLNLMQNDLEDFFDNVFFGDLDKHRGRLNGFIEVKNASKKDKAAQEAAWVLRENGLDVLDYSNSQILSDETLIKDYKGNFLQAQAIAKYLKVGKIIVSYDSNYHYDTTVVLGQDYKIKGVKNGKH